MPIVNEQAPAPADATAAAAPATMPAPGADLLSVPMAEPETAPAPTAPAPEAQVEPAKAQEPAKAPEPVNAQAVAPQNLLPADNKAEQAVSDWNAGLPPANTDAKAPLPEKPVEEVKAKPAKTAKSEPAKQPLIASEPKKKTASAPKAASPKATSDADGALPPPYVAIQAKKNGTAPAKTSTVSAAPKMAPVVDEGKTAATVHRDVEGNTNKNVADVTKATGDTAAMVAKGGGVIEKTIPGRTVPVTTTPSGIPMPVGMMKAAPAAPPEAPMETIPLAINGGRSLPPGTVETRAYAQIPTPAPQETVAPQEPAPQAEDVAPAQDVAPVNAVPPSPQPAPPPQETLSGAAPIATGSNDAPALVAQAQAAEKAGQMGDALELYQKALEDDAIYGDGHSIDRGAVYDRIGAIRAGQ
jgi:hypothetical protein